MMHELNWNSLFVLLLAIAGILFSTLRKKLTLPAALTGGVLGCIMYAGGGYTSLAILVAFFVMGTAATSWKKKEKLLLKMNDSHQLTRNTGQVLANAGVAALLALLACLLPAQKVLWLVMLAGSMAAATADTLSSELGTVYGRRFYHVLSWKPDTRGLDGVISIEGTLIGAAGAAIIAAIHAWGNGWSSAFFIIVLAGAAGNFVDSILGAALERKQYLTNDAVNFFNTLSGALVAGGLWFII